MLHVGLDLSRRRIDVCVVGDDGSVVDEFGAQPDADGLRILAGRFAGEEVTAVIESMTGARFVHDRLEETGWTVEIADAARVKALASVAAKTDRIDARLLATLSHRDLVPAIWLPSPGIRGDRELARFRLFLVGRRTSIKNRIHSSLTTWGITVPVSDLFGVSGREFLSGLDLPDRWMETVSTSLEVIDHLDDQIACCRQRLVDAGRDDPIVGLLKSAPGIADVLAFTIASEIGDISRFASPNRLVSYSGLTPRVIQSGDTDRRGPLTKAGPRWLRWALIEATIWAAKHPAYAEAHQTIRRRLGPYRGPKVARIDTARRLTTAIWWMLTRNEPFAPRGSRPPLAA
jgi:transposase